MVQAKTCLSVADNTGVKRIMCIRVLKHSSKVANIGDIIVGVVKESAEDATIKRSTIVKAVIVRSKKHISRKNGCFLGFGENAAVLLNSDMNNPVGTRILGPLPTELRERGFLKILALASEIL